MCPGCILFVLSFLSRLIFLVQNFCPHKQCAVFTQLRYSYYSEATSYSLRMGVAHSAENSASGPKTDAKLYYFGGRGRADQVRWMLAATRLTFHQEVVTSREQFLELRKRSLLFGQLPLLEIDGFQLVQSQAIIRYLARRADIAGQTREDEVKADMIAEAINDLIVSILPLAFKRTSPDGLRSAQQLAKDKFHAFATRFETILTENGGVYLVGSATTYADILMAHCLTWFVEELGPEILEAMPNLIGLQNGVISLPEVQQFIKGPNYYPIGDTSYAQQVMAVLDRRI